MPKKVRRKISTSISSNRMLFLSVVLLLIVFEALYILKSHVEIRQSEVAGISTQK